MDISIIRKTYHSVEISLSQRRIKDSLDILHKAVKDTQNGLLIDEVYTIEQSYKNMLTFLLDGFKDPHKSDPYNHLIINTLTLADNIFAELIALYYKDHARISIKDALGINSFIDILNEFKNSESLDIPELDTIVREDDVTRLFNAIAFSAMPTQVESQEIESVFYGDLFTDDEKLNLVSACFISLSNYFDERKMRLLMKLTESDNYKLRTRALVVFVIMLIKYDQRLSFYPAILNHLKMMSDSEVKCKEVKSILRQLLNAQETEKVSNKFANEILPDMIKINPIIRKKLDLDNLLSDKHLNADSIPDWEEIMNNSPELIDKINEINRMQLDGMDLLSSTFKQLKTFTFFETIRHWFLPFSLTQSYITATLNSPDGQRLKPFLRFVDKIPTMCNSDKYSMFFAMGTMPILQNDILSKIGNDEASIVNEFAESLNTERSISNHANLYIQDLYRFLTAYSNKSDFENVFELSFKVYNATFFKLLFTEISVIKEFADYYYKNHYFNNAIELFLVCNSRNEPQAELLQKIGFCYQQIGEYALALEYYLKADFFEINRHWNLKKIALCYRNTNEPQKALDYYLLAEKEMPNNLHTQASIGECLIQLHNYESALKYYFKVEFLDPSNKQVWKPIAWCCFVLGKFEVSEKYYLKLLSQEAVNHLDVMSYGHLLWVMGRKREALEKYKLSLRSQNASIKLFIEYFEQEVEYLKRHGIDEIEISVLLDQLRYILEE